jgi:hypothetical protein
MSVEDENTVDAIGLEIETGIVVLTIADHLDWSDQSSHEMMLQEKLNHYLSFIESEEILTAFPSARDRSVRIDVVLRIQPSAGGAEFLERVRQIVTGAGIGFRVKLGSWP